MPLHNIKTFIRNRLADGTLTGCIGYYGFPIGTHDCARCSDNEKCKQHTHLIHGNQILRLTRTTVTISTGGYKQTKNYTTISTQPIKTTEIFLRLLRHAGTEKQDLLFLIDQNGNTINFKTSQEWYDATDIQQ